MRKADILRLHKNARLLPITEDMLQCSERLYPTNCGQVTSTYRVFRGSVLGPSADNFSPPGIKRDTIHDDLVREPLTTDLILTVQPIRKLAVLLHADVVGSTALVQLHETLAHQRIQDTFGRFSETINNYNGVAHEIRGDALVAEFARASDAVNASLAFQASNAAHNEELADKIRPVVRVGIAMGEVVVADNTVTGEGVVLAQRLEQLAEQGSMCIQGAIYETIPKRFPFCYENLGEQQVKGFDEPVRLFEVSWREV